MLLSYLLISVHAKQKTTGYDTGWRVAVHVAALPLNFCAANTEDNRVWYKWLCSCTCCDVAILPVNFCAGKTRGQQAMVQAGAEPHVLLFMLLSYLLISVQVKQNATGYGASGCVAACVAIYISVLPTCLFLCR